MSNLLMIAAMVAQVSKVKYVEIRELVRVREEWFRLPSALYYFDSNALCSYIVDCRW